MKETRIVRRLEGLLDGLIKRKEIHSAVMSVVSADETFRWAGARGVVSRDGTRMLPTWLFHAPELGLFLAGGVSQITAGAIPFKVVPRVLRVMARG